MCRIMKKLVDAFYGERSIVNHQIASYNDFLEKRLQSIVDSTIIGQEEEMERGYIYPEIEGYKIKFGKITVGKPEVKEADGTIRDLSPMEARLRDLTYEAPLELEFIPVRDEVEYEPEIVRTGELPIMVKSKGDFLNSGSFGVITGTIWLPGRLLSIPRASGFPTWNVTSNNGFLPGSLCTFSLFTNSSN